MSGLRALDVPNVTASADVGEVRGRLVPGHHEEPDVAAAGVAEPDVAAAGVAEPDVAAAGVAEPDVAAGLTARAGVGAWGGVAAGTGAMICVGGSVAVSSVLAKAPVFTAEAVRYAMACLILLLLARLTGRRLMMPRGTEWLWLCGIAATGLVLFNVALVAGSRHAEPAVLGVAVACVPSLLAVIGPLLEGSRPRPVLVAAALVVTCGAALVQGTGRTDGVGVAWAVVVFGCEAAFTLLAIPVLGRHGPWGVSVHATWLAAVIFAAIGLVREGPAAAVRLGYQDWLAIVYLGVAVTAAAFVMWYSSVGRLGASRAGLLAGVAPVAAAVTGVLLGGQAPRPQVWAGIAVVAAGLALGLRGRGNPGRDDVASRRLLPSRCDIVTVGAGRDRRRDQEGGLWREDRCTFSIPVTSGVTFRSWFPGPCTPVASLAMR